jgi:SSS family solute:Na+ symporter
MSLLWLTFCNIFVGIFVAFVFIAPAARRVGHRLDAHTFPELLGRRYQSKFIQIFTGLVIFLFMPFYAAAVLIGAAKFIQIQFGVDYGVALMIFTIIIATYVVVGGLKGVMYTDALQGCIMFVGMIVLIVSAYSMVGGVVEGHKALNDLAPLAPPSLQAIGHKGWTAMPAFGFTAAAGKTSPYDLWWLVISSLTLGVGLGVLAQPQLVVRFMTVKSGREINRAVPTGGVFILAMTGVAFTVGAISNVYFTQHGKPITGKIVKMTNEAKKEAFIQIAKQDNGNWSLAMKKDNTPAIAPVVLTDTPPVTVTIDGKEVSIVEGRGLSIVYAGGDTEQIIPAFITTSMPKWFGVLFLLTLLSAAMSTVASQFHVVGTSIGRDVYEQITGSPPTISVTRTGILIGIVFAVVIGYAARDMAFIARATAIFFGLCAASFLPAFVGGLFFRGMTKAGAIASAITGFGVSAFWVVLVKWREAADIGLVQKLTDHKTSILSDHQSWPSVDSIVIALPISIVVAVVVSLLTKPSSKEHLDKCFS